MTPVYQRALSELGLKPVQLQALLSEHPDALAYRVTAVDRGLCNVLGYDAQLALQELRVRPPVEALAVGDFVVLDGEAEPTVSHILPRTTLLQRGTKHDGGQAQLIATNLDVVFVVAAFAATEKLERRALQVRRIERYVAAVREGGSVPVIVLNKVDITRRSDAELQELLKALRARLHDVDVLLTSAESGDGLEAIARYLTPGITVGFIGMSGVGKSSLVNALLQTENQRVSAAREADSKGRHTTTRRELIRMPGGALLVDTPGMREFAVLAEGSEVAGFHDIDELAQQCRFTNCGHGQEPGCAVRAAVEAGHLEADRLEHYEELSRDAQRLSAKHDARARAEENRRGRAFGRMVRQAVRHKTR